MRGWCRMRRGDRRFGFLPELAWPLGREWAIVRGKLSREMTVARNEDRLSGVSNEAVAKATGRDWEEWVEFLDGLGGQEKSHKEIVALLAGPGGLSNGWWQQSVAVGYEQAKGLRVVGQSSTADFQIGVQRTLGTPREEVWKLLIEGSWRDVWLGTTGSLGLRKGERYETAEGARGEVRSVVVGERLRITWESNELERPSTLQIYLAASGEKTSVRFHQERLSNLEERERMRERWRAVLDKLEGLAGERGGDL